MVGFRYVFFLLFITIYFTACSTLERSLQSGYGQTPLKPTIQLSEKEQAALISELGFTPESLSTPDIASKYSTLLELKSLEKSLFDQREKRQYYNNLPWFKDEEERVSFLRQPGYGARQLWLRKNGVGARPSEYNADQEDLVEKKDISLGMPQETVKRAWGSPDAVEIAGNPIYRNQRWSYKRFIASSDGYKLQNRIIYFEGGKVVGWEQNEAQ